MKAAIDIEPRQEQGLVDYNLTDQAIQALSDKYMPLVITDLEDEGQLKTVHEARMDIKGRRVAVDKQRKELKKEALAWGKKVDSAAKHIFGQLLPIEEHLMAEEIKVLEEQNRIKEKERVKIQARVDELLTQNCVKPFMEVATLTDEEYDTLLFDATETYTYELERKAEEKAAFKKEKARLAKIADEQDAERIKLENERKADKHRKELAAKELREEQETIRAKLKAEQDRLDMEKRAIEREKIRLADEQFAREKEIADKAKAEQGEKDEAERFAKEQLEFEVKRKANTERQERLAPDIWKIGDYLSRLSRRIDETVCSELETNEGKTFREAFDDGIGQILDRFSRDLEEL